MEHRPVGTRQARELLLVAFGPSIVALVVIAAVVLLQLLIANSDMTGALGAIASMWLGVHQVPVTIAGRELSVMPLLPVLAMVWGTARTTARATPATGSWFVIRWIVGSALAPTPTARKLPISALRAPPPNRPQPAIMTGVARTTRAPSAALRISRS